MMRFVNLLYGRPGCGKSRFIHGINGCLIIDIDLNNEYIGEGVVDKIPCVSYADVLKAVNKAKNSKANVIALDSATALYLKLISEIPRRIFEQGHGKGWFELQMKFEREIFAPLLKSGKHLWLIGHSRASIWEFRDGSSDTTIEPYLGTTLYNSIAIRASQILYMDNNKNGTFIYAAPFGVVNNVKDTTGRLPGVLKLDKNNLFSEYRKAMFTKGEDK